MVGEPLADGWRTISQPLARHWPTIRETVAGDWRTFLAITVSHPGTCFQLLRVSSNVLNISSQVLIDLSPNISVIVHSSASELISNAQGKYLAIEIYSLFDFTR
jgi:hypothetical protein